MYKKKKGKKKSKRKTRVTKRGKNVHIGVAPGDHVKEEKNEEEEEKKECPVDGCEDGMIDISVGPKRKVECKECKGEGYV